MSNSIDLLDPEVILKYGTNVSALDDFERFAQSYLELHDKYDYSMIKRIEEFPNKVGFIDDIYHFYVLTDSGLIIYETNQETGIVNEFYRFQTSNKIQNVSQNPHNPYLFALLTNGEIVVFNFSTKESQAINLDKKVTQVSWLSNNSCLVCLFYDLLMAVIDLGKCQVQTTKTKIESKIDSHFLISHPNHNIAAVCDDQLRLIDFRESAKIRNFVLKKKATSISWLPQNYFGCAVGYSDGCIDFFSFDKDSVVMSQNVISQPIRGIEFCPTNSCSVSLIVDKDILFVSMPSWGFGSLGKVASYKTHLAPIVDAHWISDDVNTSMITCDNDHMVHIFDVPEEYMPIYEP
ncbi:hypothetical protein M9Y10_013578 [Tritrichomonas musculus]|uniref:RRN6 beta-propeller domain-containing protein n=1 Tax=Tritrichomonas musculus TaxID=1915356 RepID=A0ABR2KX54_9EUKA